MAAYYKQQSFGKLTLTGSVFGWFTIPNKKTEGCGTNYSKWADAARAKAGVDGVDLTQYHHVVYAFPVSCGWAGMGEMPGARTWIAGPSFSLGVVAHELGHNFGAHHAASWGCGSQTIGASCALTEYGDPFDVMGAAWEERHMNNWHKGQLGWLATANVKTVNASGTYSLAPIEKASTGVQILRVAGTGGNYYDLEFRQPFGFDDFAVSDPVVNGVSIRLDPAFSSITQSRLLDTTPGDSNFGNAALALGKTFTDTAAGVTIKTASVSATAASVQVTLASTAKPAAPTGLTTSVLTFPLRAEVRWTASTGAWGYRVLRNGVAIAETTG